MRKFAVAVYLEATTVEKCLDHEYNFQSAYIGDGLYLSILLQRLTEITTFSVSAKKSYLIYRLLAL